MLVIRPEQMAAFRKHAITDFRTRLRAHLHEYFAALGKHFDPSLLDRHIELALERAPRFRMTRECDIARLLEIACSYLEPDGTVWESKQAIRILCDYEAAPDARLAAFEKWAAQTASGRQPARM